MITSDPGRRQTVLREILALLDGAARPEDRDLLRALAPIAYSQMPDTMTLRLPPAALAARIQRYFTFIVRTIPPSHQLYRGLPGLHVSVRNPTEDETDATGSTHGGQYEITIVETHTPDVPFVFESLKNYLKKQGLRLFSAVHPTFTVQRQWERVVAIGPPGGEEPRELFCSFRIERVEPPERLRRMEHQMYALLKSVFLAVEDHADMQRTIRDLEAGMRDRRPDAQETAPARAFVDWLLDENYVVLGVLRFRPDADGLTPDHTSALGAFREPDLLPVVFPGLMEEEARHLIVSDTDTRIVDIDFRNHASAIHHVEPIDDIVVREWGPSGELAGATLLLGRLSKAAFTARPESIPLLQPKLAWLLARADDTVDAHSLREIRTVFNRFPKRELFYTDLTSLEEIVNRIIFISSDDEIAVTVRHADRYTAVCVAFSTVRYSHKAERDLGSALADDIGPVAFQTWADCGATALLVFYFSSPLDRPIDPERVRERTAAAIATWEDQVASALERSLGTVEGRRLFKRYVRPESRSGLYRELTDPAEVPADLRCLEGIEGRVELAVLPESADTLTLKIFSPRAVVLTDLLRMLQNLGLTVDAEVNIPLALPEGQRLWLERLRISASPAVVAAIHERPERLASALRAIQEEHATDDALNGLVLAEGLEWREVEVLRAVRNHLLQIRPTYNAETVTAVLLRNQRVARALFDAFAAKFDPAVADRRTAIEAADAALHAAFESVPNLVDDEILRGMANLIAAAVRTNVYQRPERPVVAIKVESAKIDALPTPHPLFETYVHSRLLQGIHLRGGKVARGGIRWSDRQDDFRAEILGLMNTQMMKNAIIVPVGSKGGFVLKGSLPPRPALDAYLVERYREFISGLLDVTDNLVHGQVVHPPEVVRYDHRDPYLVVAADKGTAHLSDTANRVSMQYSFWLGDAFASGGSHGYDHKKEGITARGVWECVKHHFRTLDLDIQAQPFTMAGIGDMSGDVFGNGLLRSRTTRLVAAFNHQHVFLDPDPDPERSFEERQRLFVLPRSTWRDYDTSLISPGGGVFDRSAKAIPLSPEVRALLDLDQDAASGEEVVRAILRARVDLLYNGGIGTYVKASSERDAEVADRGNDRVRVNGRDLRARVVGEGGNLGFTQKARLEYWAAGGLANTDAVDNSGGVDMSDHEVNIKILLDLLVQARVIESRAERNRLLAEMTGEVSELVLADNAGQSLALTLDGIRSQRAYDEAVSLVADLVAAGILDPADDAVPSRDELAGSPSRQRGLPRPLLCILLARVKNWAVTQIADSSLPESEVARPLLTGYFPRQMRERFADHLSKHPLRREIVTTAAVNRVVNQAGVGFIYRAMVRTGAPVSEVAQAYLMADEGSAADAARERLKAEGLPAADEHVRLVEIEDRLAEATVRLLRRDSVDLAETLNGVKGTA
jgi:glutamate dehydrogenase